jgi:hypothetical protein
LIEQAYRFGEQCGLSVWTEDEAGPYQAIPQAGKSWHPQGQPDRQPHEYARGGTAKLLTLFHPATGQLRVHGVSSSCNAVLHPWLKEELRAIVAAMAGGALCPFHPPPGVAPSEDVARVG